MFCSKCGTEVSNDSKFCPVCGAPMTPDAPAETPIENNVVNEPIEAPVETPVTPVETPVAPVETPVAPVETPVAPVETPVAPVEAPVQPPVAPVQPPVTPVQPPVAPVAPAYQYTQAPVAPVAPAPKKKLNPIVIIIPVVIVALIIFGVIVSSIFGGSSKPADFNDLYSDIQFESWCEIAPDGSWMKLDTNPEDIDDDYLILYMDEFNAANEKVQEVNTELGFPSSVYAKMNETTALQGRQTETYGSYRVSWTYHPDKGLEVMYEIID